MKERKLKRFREVRKPRNISKIVIGLVLLLALMASSPLLQGLPSMKAAQFWNARATRDAPAYQTRGPIIINGHNGFTSTNGVTGGSGTAFDPFVIQGWQIDSSNPLTGPVGISISNTQDYFIIRNVYIYTTPTGIADSTGIEFSHAGNGTLQNSVINGNDRGIFMISSASMIITNNQLTGNLIGIEVGSSDNNTFIFNSITQTSSNLFDCTVTEPATSILGFVLVNSLDNHASYNNVIGGDCNYFLDYSNSTIMANNSAASFTKDGFAIHHTSGNLLEQNTAHDGNIGFHIGGFQSGESASGVVLKSNVAYNDPFNGFSLDIGSLNSLLVSNIAYANSAPAQTVGYGAGFSLFATQGNTLISNRAYDNGVGFLLHRASMHNRFSSNIAAHNGDGIELYDSSNLNVFNDNQVYGSTADGGIFVDNSISASISETFAYNTIHDNTNGIVIALSINDTVLGNIVFGNNRPGLVGYNSGILFQGIASSNITANIVFNNNVGLNDERTGTGQIGGNLIYDNVFSGNTFNANIGNCVSLNGCIPDAWNVTERPGPNIIGGSNRGGNFWGDYLGVANNQGFGTTSYPIQTCVLTPPPICNSYGFGTDFLPLVFPTTGTNPYFSIDGFQTLNVGQEDNGTGVVLLTSHNGFAATVSLAVSAPNPSYGPSATASPSPITLFAGTTYVSALNITNTRVPGTYTLTVTATSGSASAALPITVTVQANTPLLSVVRGSDNGIYVSAFLHAWSNWITIPGETAAAPVLCSSGGDVDILVRGLDNSTIWVLNILNGVSTTWSSPGGETRDQPSCAILDGVLYVVVRGLDSGIWVNYRTDPSGTWHGWVAIGGATSMTPVMIGTEALNRLDFVVVGLDGGLWHRWAIGGYLSPWTAVGGSTPSVPAVASNGTALIMVVRGQDNMIWSNSYMFRTMAWSGWSSLAGTTMSQPSLVSDSMGAIHLLVVGLNGAIYHKAMSPAGSWAPTWDSPGGSTNHSIALVSEGPTLVIMVQGNDRGIYSVTLAGSSWLGWTSLGGTTYSAPSVSTTV